jgi:hypothetical protein
MWIGDVGQNTWEEISRVDSAGANLGWRIREAAYCFNPSTGCTSAGLTPPARTMQRSHAQSITGGAFFTGDTNCAYHGVYIFGDYVTNNVWAMRPNGGALTDSVRIGQNVYNVVSFDRDSRGRVFATSLSNTSSVAANNGVVFILESPDMVAGSVTPLRPGRRAAASPAIRVGDVLRNPGAYALRDLDGRELRGVPSGVFFAAEKDGIGAAVLMTGIR